MTKTKIKICGLSRPCDAEYVNEARPDFAGFVFYEKSGRYVSPKDAKALRKQISPGIQTVGVFVGAPAEEIDRICREKTIHIVQLHGSEDETYLKRLKDALPGVPVWKAFQIGSEKDLERALACSADFVLLDGGAGDGKRFDWSLFQSFPRPFILAGGLHPENIPEAIKRFHPFAVDLSTGVETNGAKDKDKILAAVSAAKGG
jgi:phosphoribosylanthranilate isomerase